VYGRGTALNLVVKSPGYDSKHGDNVPYADVSAVHNEKDGTITLFAVNRHASESVELDIALHGFDAPSIIEHKVMTHPDLEAVNSIKTPDEVVPRDGTGAVADGNTVTLSLPPYSYQMVRLKA